MSDVFVSYASQDRERVAPLVQRLEQLGFSIWWDREIAHGQNYHRVIEQALDGAKCAIVVWSAQSINSEWVVNEASSARQRNVLVPVLIDAVEPPLEFRHLQSADLRAENPAHESEFDKLTRSVRRLLGDAPTNRARAGAAAERAAASAGARARSPINWAIGAGVLLGGAAALLLVLKQLGWIGAQPVSSVPAPTAAQAPAAASAEHSGRPAEAEPAPAAVPSVEPVAGEAAQPPSVAAQPADRVNLFLPANGAQLIAASEEGWRLALETQELTCRVLAGGSFATVGLRDGQGARIDTLAVHVEYQSTYNLKRLELYAGDAEQGPFRKLGAFDIPNYRNMRTPFHEFKFEAASARYVKLQVSGFQHGEGPNGYVCTIRLYEAL